MNTVLTKERLEQILDQALQDVTEQTAGVRLNQGDQPPGEDLCTVHITFDKGFSTSLTLCADRRRDTHVLSGTLRAGGTGSAVCAHVFGRAP